MKFDELKLLVAISRAKKATLGGSDPVTDADRLRYADVVRDEYAAITSDIYFPWTTSEVITLAVNHRKQTSTKIKAEIAEAHGYECFWRHRQKGPCCDEAEGGHVIPQASGADLSVANGMIECRSHNNQRRERSIEQYLASNDRTDRSNCEG